MARIYRRILLPMIAPIFVARAGGIAAIRHQDLPAPRHRHDRSAGPACATTVPAIYVYDLMFQRGQMAEGAAGAIMILVALSLVLVPYTIWINLRQRREAQRG